MDQVKGPVALLVSEILGRENDVINSMVLNYLDEELPDASKIHSFMTEFVPGDKAETFMLRLSRLLTNTHKNLYNWPRRSAVPPKVDRKQLEKPANFQADMNSSRYYPVPLESIELPAEKDRSPDRHRTGSSDTHRAEKETGKENDARSEASKICPPEPLEVEPAVVSRDSECNSNNPPSNIKSGNKEQDKGEQTPREKEMQNKDTEDRGTQDRRDGQEEKEARDMETERERETQERETEKERGEEQDREKALKESGGRSEATSQAENDAPNKTAGTLPRQQEANEAGHQTGASLEMKSMESSSEVRSRSHKRCHLLQEQSPGGLSLGKNQSPRGKAGGASHRSQSPTSRSPSQGRRTWLQERSAPDNSASPGRSRSSSSSSRSSDSDSSPEKHRKKESLEKSHEKRRRSRHHSESSVSSASGERHSYHKEKGSSERRSNAHGRRSPSQQRSQSPVRSRSDKHSHRKLHKSDSDERPSDHDSESASRSKSKRDSHEKHHRSKSDRSHDSRSRHRSRSERRSSSGHDSPSSKRKRSTSRHRSHTRSRSKSPRHSRTGHRSSSDSSRSSHDRSPTSKKRRSPSDQKSQGKSKSEKHSEGKKKSSHHGKKSKRHHKKSKSSNKSKSNKHSSHKEKSSHHKSPTSKKQKQSHRSSSERGRSNSADRSSAEEKYHRHRSYTPTGRFSHSYARSESPRNRSTSPESGLYQQRRMPQYGSQGQYGRAGFTHYMTQSPGRYNNYRRGGWTGQQQNFNVRNTQRWIPNNNNNRNRMGFYRRPGWTNNNTKNNFQNNFQNNRNMCGYQRGRFQQHWNHANNNYQNRQQQQQRRWQSPSSYPQGRRYQPRQYSPSSWDGSSLDSPSRQRSRRRSSSVSMSPAPKKRRKSSSSSASPYKSPAVSPNPTKKAAAKRPARSPSASPGQPSRSASECSEKKGSPGGGSSPASPVELQNLRVVVDNVPAQDEEGSEMSERVESRTSGSESPAPTMKPQYVRNSSEEENKEPSSDSNVSVDDHSQGNTSRKKGMTLAALDPPSKYHAHPVKGSSGKKFTHLYDSSEEEEDHVAAGCVSDSSHEGEVEAGAQSELASSEGGDVEMASRSESDHGSEDSEVEVASSNVSQDFEDSDVEVGGPEMMDSSQDSESRDEAHGVSDSTEGEHSEVVCRKRSRHHRGFIMDAAPPALKAKHLKKRLTAPVKRAKIPGKVNPGEKHMFIPCAGPFSSRKLYGKARKQAMDSSDSDSDDHWTAAPMKFQQQGYPHKCFCCCATNPIHPCTPVKKQSKSSWTQTNLSGCFMTEDEDDVSLRKKRKKVDRKKMGVSSKADGQLLHRQSRGTQAQKKASDSCGKQETKAASQRRQKTRPTRSNSPFDSDTQPCSLPAGRQAERGKALAAHSSHAKTSGKTAPTQGRQKEHLSSYSGQDIKVSQSSRKGCTKDVRKRSHSGHHHERVDRELSGSKQEAKRKTPQRCDASSLILDISSVPLPSECEQPKKTATPSGGAEKGNQQANACGTQSMANDQQKSSNVSNSSSITSQNRIFKKAWQSTVSSDSAKKEDGVPVSQQKKSPDSASHQPCTSQKELQQEKSSYVSNSKPHDKSTPQENPSESCNVPGNSVAKVREAKPGSALTGKTDSPDNKHISVKLRSAKKSPILSKKVSLSTSSSEDDVGHGRKAGTRSESGSRMDCHKSEQQEDEGDIHEERNRLKARVTKSRTKGGQMMNSKGGLKAGTPTRYYRPHSRSRFDGYKSAPPDPEDYLDEWEDEPEQRMAKSRKGGQVRAAAGVKKSMPSKRARYSYRLDACRSDPEKEDKEIHGEEDGSDLNVDQPGTTEGKNMKRRTAAKMSIPRKQLRCSKGSDSMDSSKLRLKEGEGGIHEQQNMHKLKMARQGKSTKSGAPVKNSVAHKQSKYAVGSGRLDPDRPGLQEGKERGRQQQEAHEQVLTKEGQGMKRKTALKKAAPDKRVRPCQSSTPQDTNRTEADDETYVQQNVRRLKAGRPGLKGAQTRRRGTAVRNSLPDTHTSGPVDIRLRKPKKIENEIVRYPNLHEYMAKTTGKTIKRGTGPKNRAPNTQSTAAGNNTGGPNTCRRGLKEREEDTHGDAGGNNTGGPNTCRRGLKEREEDTHRDAGGEKRKWNRCKAGEDQESHQGTAGKDSSGSDREMSPVDSVSRKGSDDLERKLREKLLRSLQAKKNDMAEDAPGAKVDPGSHHPASGP